MHIVFLSHYFPPEVNAPASRTYENAKHWVQKGAQVTVITCVPNHPNGIVYPGYTNRFWQWDEKDGIRILRVKTFIGPNKGFVKRVANYVSYMMYATLLCHLAGKADVVISTSPQFFCGLAGYFVSRRLRCPWMLEIRDLWPESIIAVGAIRQKHIICLLEKIEVFMYKKADHIISLTHAFKQHIMAKGIAEKRLSVITNGADLEQFRPVPEGENEVEKQYGLDSKFVVSFIGTHGMAHGLDTVLEAAERLKDEKDILFLLVGDGAERQRLVQEKEKRRLDNVLMVGQQDKRLMPHFISASNACMVLLKKSDLFKTVIPSKIFEAMAMGRPIIHGVEGESKKIIEDGKCGICIEPENDEQLVNAVWELYTNQDACRQLAENGKRYVHAHFNRHDLADEYLKGIYEITVKTV